MRKMLRWVALALFCALCGFAGAVGGVSLMSDDLQGEQGPQGIQGVVGLQGQPGDPGTPGERGPRGRAANVKQLQARIARLRADLNDLGPRLETVETDLAAVPTDTCSPGTPVDVVTAAALAFRRNGQATLDVEKGQVTPCQ